MWTDIWNFIDALLVFTATVLAVVYFIRSLSINEKNHPQLATYYLLVAAFFFAVSKL